MSICREISWVEAQRSCEKEGMTLLSNFYDNTMKLVVKYYREMGSETGDVIFIGLKRNKQVNTICSSINKKSFTYHDLLGKRGGGLLTTFRITQKDG